MKTPSNPSASSQGRILVLGGTGKTGRRIAARLQSMGRPVRIGSRSANPPFDWHQKAGWDACLEGVESVYISYAPDLAIPGATDAIQALVDRAEKNGVSKDTQDTAIP